MTRTIMHTTDQTVAELLATVEAGDDVVILRHGKPIAMLTATIPDTVSAANTFEIPESFYDNLHGGSW